MATTSISEANSANSIELRAAPSEPAQIATPMVEPETVEVRQSDGIVTKRPYYGKCQYKTGKCFNERTLKRNGDAHSLCEEHRIKQNLIQRRSDRKYQTVHAIRRRERSQRRAVLKKQVSMAVAQQLFYEHQQQKSLGLQMAAPGMNNQASTPLSGMDLTPPIQLPNKIELSNFSSPFLRSSEGLASSILSYSNSSLSSTTENGRPSHESATCAATMRSGGAKETPESEIKEEATGSPTGIEDFSSDSFLSICTSENVESFINLTPMLSSMGNKMMWSEDDVDFLQNLLLS